MIQDTDEHRAVRLKAFLRAGQTLREFISAYVEAAHKFGLDENNAAELAKSDLRWAHKHGMFKLGPQGLTDLQ